ncbi:MarR family transcriptional regulator [Escherichia coli]|nr:MarR family transcriptional regulator [Escherichia coli]MED0090475.1 MarR family transcriptional regulator [Escherichia coli]MED0554153.1 MarR family transcriptional regulator [Escherichia coli]MED9026596.1 MarR family transcriptional regulator [Escherichia coli]MED9075725.1 MarR family transcriptional regulator [Escherichia coli]
MNNVSLLENILDYQKNKDLTYPFQEHLLMQLCVRISNKMQDVISDGLGKHRINNTMFMVLSLLYLTDGYCLSPSEISKVLQVTKPNITRITDALEKKGVVKRVDNKCDRRGKDLCLTPDGVLFTQKMIRMQNIIMKKVWGALSDDELKRFEIVNKKILNSIYYDK